MKYLIVAATLALNGCATYEAHNRILVCFGFCALQGVVLSRQADGTLIVPVTKEKSDAVKE